MPMPGSRNAVLLVDAFRLRRASVSSFLRDWAAGEHLRIVECDWPGPGTIDGRDCALVIHSVGGARACSPEIATALLALRGLYPGAPLAVLCEGDHCDDVTTAIDCGVSGYIDGRLAADLVPHALSFLLRGGSYIPPAALASRPRDVAISLRRMLAPARGPGQGRDRIVPIPPGFVGGLRDPRFGYYLPDQETAAMPSLVPTEPAAIPVVRAERADIPSGERQGPGPRISREPPAADGAVPDLQADPHTTVAPPSSPPPEEARSGPIYAERKAAAFGMTERQMAVLRGLCKGDANKTIANRLGLTETTVKVHVREIMRKLGVGNRTQVALAVGELPPEPEERTSDLSAPQAAGPDKA
jgi:DNA-binding NarL/FixJ family response regulator